MRAVAWIRNYSLIVFLVVLAGGVILEPGGGTSATQARLDSPSPAPAGAPA